MVRERYGVQLTGEHRNQLEHLVRTGKSTARVTTPGPDSTEDRSGLVPLPRVAQALDVSEGTVYRIKRRFAEAGLEGVLRDRPQAHRYRKLDDRGEAHLIALACSPAPPGHDHWTLRLLAGKVVELGLASSMSHETVRLHLKKNVLKPWQKREWCIPKVSADFVAHMEDVLDLYAEPYDPQRPLVCFDETSTQLLAETPAGAARPAGATQTPGLRIPAGRDAQPVPGL